MRMVVMCLKGSGTFILLCSHSTVSVCQEFGLERWSNQMIEKFNLMATVRKRGRSNKGT